jgi:hypothetical protein
MSEDDVVKMATKRNNGIIIDASLIASTLSEIQRHSAGALLAQKK